MSMELICPTFVLFKRTSFCVPLRAQRVVVIAFEPGARRKLAAEGI
jgi:hypothetical protein